MNHLSDSNESPSNQLIYGNVSSKFMFQGPVWHAKPQARAGFARGFLYRSANSPMITARYTDNINIELLAKVISEKSAGDWRDGATRLKEHLGTNIVNGIVESVTRLYNKQARGTNRLAA